MTSEGTDPRRAEEMIRAVEETYDRAWGAGDVDALVDCFSPDAVLVNPREEVAEEHEQIRRSLGRFLVGEANGSRHLSTVKRVTFVSDDVVVLDGEAVIELVGGGDTYRHPFTDVPVRDGNDTWSIAHVRAYCHNSP